MTISGAASVAAESANALADSVNAVDGRSCDEAVMRKSWSGSPMLALSLLLAGCVDRVDVISTHQNATVCGQGPSIQGIDVSYYEESVDWAAAREAGIEFAFIRASDGTQFLDPKFASYWTGAKNAGVIRGAYQFFRPAQDPIAQADLLLDTIGTYEAGDLPPVIDVEVSGGRTTAQVAAAVRAWVDHVTAAIGRSPIIYTGQYAWADLTGGANFTTSPLWIAQYTTAACPYLPNPWTQWSFWQVSESGSVAGVPGSIDLDLFNGSRNDLLAFAGGELCGNGTCGGDETVDSCPADCPIDDGSGDDASVAPVGCSTGGDAGLIVALAALFARRRTRRQIRHT